MTKKIYNVEAKGTVRLWMDIEASSQEEAEALAEKCALLKFHERILDTGPWRPLHDGYILKITSVREEAPPKLIQIPKPDFDPAWDD